MCQGLEALPKSARPLWVRARVDTGLCATKPIMPRACHLHPGVLSVSGDPEWLLRVKFQKNPRPCRLDSGVGYFAGVSVAEMNISSNQEPPRTPRTSKFLKSERNTRWFTIHVGSN